MSRDGANGLDALGAAEGLGTQTIMLRIKSVDATKLGQSIATTDKSVSPTAQHEMDALERDLRRRGEIKDTKSLGGAIEKALLSPALSAVSAAPQLVLEVAAPFVKSRLKDSGIIADVSTTDSPPPAHPPHEMATVLGMGAVMGATGVGLGYGLYRLIAHFVRRK